MAYFDNAATTYPKPEVVYTSMDKFYRSNGANAGRGRYNLAQSANIIVCPYQHLVEQWVDDIVKFNIQPIIGYSSSSQKDWKKRLSKAVRDQKLRSEKCFFCFICTNATFTNSFVQEQIEKIKSPVLLVVDEAHNFGARSYAKLLDERFTYRLALSATLERHRDEEGFITSSGRSALSTALNRQLKKIN